MGVIDETSVKLSCEKCGAAEVQRAVQKGSVYGVGAWGNFGDFSQFDASTKQGIDGPEVTSATCKKCKAPARIA
jgi:hypothetical protein